MNLIYKTGSSLILSVLIGACFAQDGIGHYKEQPQALAAITSYNPALSRVTKSHGIDAPSGQLADSLLDLKNKASSGDADASAQLYAGLSACKGMKGPPVSSNYSSQCKGISEEDISEQGKWLDLAARLGDERAQYAYAVGGFGAIVGSAQNGLKNPELASHYANTSRSYLDGLAKKCNVDAIAAIADDAGNGGLIYGNDPERAYKFSLIKEMIQQDSSPPHYIAFTKYLESKISPPSRLSVIREQASDFVNQYCR